MKLTKFWVLRKASVICHFYDGGATIGETAKDAELPKSTVRRHLETLAKEGYLTCEIVSYKSTGKRVYFVTEKGLEASKDKKAWMQL